MAAVPYNVAVAISESDTVNFLPVAGRFVCDAIYVGGAGVVAAVLESGNVVSFTCVAGQILPIAAKRVNAASDATLMVALYKV